MEEQQQQHLKTASGKKRSKSEPSSDSSQKKSRTEIHHDHERKSSGASLRENKRPLSNSANIKPKTKKKKPQKKKSKKVQIVSSKTRNFEQDLEQYLLMWVRKCANEENEWKFNKVLQAWALDNWYNKKVLSGKTFKLLLPYTATVRGAALDRLASLVMDVISKNGEANFSSSKPDITGEVSVVSGESQSGSVVGGPTGEETTAQEEQELLVKTALKRALKVHAQIKDIIP